MSKKFIFKLNKSGVRDLLRSEAMQTVLNEKATQIVNRCGPGYKQEERTGRNRAIARVSADEMKARIDNSKNNTILKALR